MVAILLGTGFEEAEALVPADLLRRAGADVRLVGLDDLAVTGGHGITVVADCTLDELNAGGVELVMLPGGMGGVEAIRACPAALELVRAVAARKGWVTAICAAPTVLAGLGLLEGRAAVCYPGMEDMMGNADVKAGSPVVVDGNFITGEGPGSAFPFGLKLVEALCGADAAARVRGDTHYHG